MKPSKKFLTSPKSLVLLAPLIPIFSVLFPAFVFAQQADGLKGLLVSFGRIIDLLIPITAAAALLFFFWGLANFILNAGSEEGQEQGKEVMKWGIVALFVLTSIWGIVVLIQDDLGLDSSFLPQSGSVNPHMIPGQPGDRIL